MSKKFMRMMSLMLVIIMTLSVLVACSPAEEPAAPTENGSNEPAAPSEEPVELVLWEQMDPAAQEVIDELIVKFNEENPMITVVRNHYETEELRTSFQSAALSGQGPDLVYGPNDNIGIFLVSDLIQPVSDVISQDFLDQLAPNALESTVVDGKMWGVPDINGNQIALLYNKAMIAEAPNTWEELVEMATPYQNIDTANPENSTFGFLYNEREPFWFVGLYGAYGGKVFDAERNPTLNNDAMVKALKFVVDIKAKDGLGDVEMNYDIADSLFKQGKAAFILNGAWSWTGYIDEGIDLGIAPLPELPGGGRGLPYSSTKAYLVSKEMDPAKKDAVAKFLEYVMMPENNAKYAIANSQSPTNLAAMELDVIKSNDMIKASVETIEYTTPMPIIAEMRAVWDAIRPELEAVIAGEQTPEAAAEGMQKRAEEGIEIITGE